MAKRSLEGETKKTFHFGIFIFKRILNFLTSTGFEKSEFWWSPKEGKVVGGPGAWPPEKFFEF